MLDYQHNREFKPQLKSHMIIPWETLDQETLYNVVESVVLREAVDYQLQEKTLAQQVQEVIQLLQQGKAVIVWSELHESVNIVDKERFNGQRYTES